jgi:hypothetical protein
MRENPLKIALFLLSAALLPLLASAKPVKPAHARATTATATRKSTAHNAARPARHPAADTLKVSGHTHARAEAKASRHPGPPTKGDLHVAHWVSGHHPPERRQPELLIADRRGHQRTTRQSRVPEAPHAEDRHAEARHEEAPSSPGHRHSPIEEAHADPPIEAPTPAAAPALPPIEVHHNRKIHLTPDAPAPARTADATPRKATIQDFLSTPAAASANDDSETPDSPPSPTAPAPKHSLQTSSLASLPAHSLPAHSLPSHSIVERKLPTLVPTPVLIPTLVPDPVTEPVLYTPRGRLIVPPAMKGSHDILVHQNEMADHDGLERIQNDAHLERLRTSRQLVALPTSAALEVDERLPENRRFCRPWTAQFLALLARAHYARFHTPLQVNSAVRTVEFQERLRYTNGNAAPAEGETASPHLTGQAVDLAKHGLSLTEIAWLRGYLMPLVQQGKIDVEEEFQQACFHISVYKKYTPQPVPRRNIPPHHGTASSLAAAIQ